MESEMGLTYVNCEVSKTDGSGKAASVRFLVDSGAYLTLLPESVWKEIELKPTDEEIVELADGSRSKRPFCIAKLNIKGRVVHSGLLLGTEKDSPLLGVVALEEGRFTLDPVKRRVVPIIPRM